MGGVEARNRLDEPLCDHRCMQELGHVGSHHYGYVLGPQADRPRPVDPADDLAAGTAAEHLVCADLLLSGHRAFLADQNCPYDVAVEYRRQLVRIQVKSTRAPRAIPQREVHTPAYMWHVRRAGKKGQRVYAEDEFDMLALVALDVQRIAYLPPSKLRQTIHIRTYDHAGAPLNGGRSGKTFSMFPFSVALAEVTR